MFARIYRPSKSAMQSGQAKSSKWALEFDAQASRTIDPLMGWTGASDMAAGQTRLFFDTKESAVAYAKTKGLPFVIESENTPKVRAKAYSDNFAFRRRQPWTH